MDLRALTLVDLTQCLTRVRKTMKDERKRTKFVDAAVEDVPIVGELACALGRLSAEMDKPGRKQIFDTAYEHFLIFLALRELDSSGPQEPQTRRRKSGARPRKTR